MREAGSNSPKRSFKLLRVVTDAVVPLVLHDQHIPLFETEAHIAKAIARLPLPILVEKGPLIGVVFRIPQVYRRRGNFMLIEVAKAEGRVAGHIDLLGGLKTLIRALLGEEKAAIEASRFSPLIRVPASSQRPLAQNHRSQKCCFRDSLEYCDRKGCPSRGQKGHGKDSCRTGD